jgi:hypothetical protein
VISLVSLLYALLVPISHTNTLHKGPVQTAPKIPLVLSDLAGRLSEPGRAAEADAAAADVTACARVGLFVGAVKAAYGLCVLAGGVSGVAGVLREWVVVRMLRGRVKKDRRD